MMTAQHGLKIIAFGLLGFGFAPWLPLIAAMVAAGFVGTLIGSRLLGRLSEHRFELIIKTLLTVLALDLVLRPLWQLME